MIDFKEIFVKNNKILPQRANINYLKNNGLFGYVNSFFDDSYSIQEKLYCLIYDCVRPKCKICGKDIKFSHGYNTYCSRKCVNKDPAILEKNKKSVSVSLKNTYQKNGNEIKKKRKETLLNRYSENVYSPFGLTCVKEKTKEKIKEKYGVENVFYLKKFRSHPKVFQEKSVINNRLKGYDIEYVSAYNIIIKNLCPIHGDVKMNSINFYNRAYRNRKGIICTVCNPINSFSSLEIIFNNLLNELNVTNYIKNTKKIIKPYELDFYFPEFKLAVELNGVYWHSEIHTDKFYHKNKSDMCSEKDIQLIHIWEDDLLNKYELIKSMFAIKFNLCKNKIYARKCNIKDISPKIYRQFLHKNHIQGVINSSIKYGLFYNNELVSVMGFGKLRNSRGQKNKQYEYELHRFASIQNTIVTGGALKLLSYFEHNVKYTKLISYAKLDHSNSDIYIKLGFKLNKICQPSYYWVIDAKRKHRYNYRKDNISNDTNKNLTSTQTMHDLGFFRCFDSGNLKFIKEKKLSFC
jgi:hypothetical protein